MPTPIDVTAPPSGTGCAECLQDPSAWWFHLHAAKTSHPVIRSFEPGESWFWDYTRDDYSDGPELAPPDCRPLDQPAPGPQGRVPADWQSKLKR